MASQPPRRPSQHQDLHHREPSPPRRSVYSHAGAGRPCQYDEAPARSTPSLPSKPFDWRADD